ncbi:hypothetical protein ACHAWF_006541 [Thalassiosira exigua]
MNGTSTKLVNRAGGRPDPPGSNSRGNWSPPRRRRHGDACGGPGDDEKEKGKGRWNRLELRRYFDRALAVAACLAIYIVCRAGVSSGSGGRERTAARPQGPRSPRLRGGVRGHGPREGGPGGGRGKKREKPDWVGPYSRLYPKKERPPEGWTRAIDYFFRRPSHGDREEDYVTCLSELRRSEVDDGTLADAARLGLTGTTTYLLETFELDPLRPRPAPAAVAGGEDGTPIPPATRPFGALQEALIGGYAEIARVLTGGNYKTVVDGYGRTVEDYVSARGSPFRPAEAERVLGMDPERLAELYGAERYGAERYGAERGGRGSPKTKRRKFDSGWNAATADEYDSACDIDEIYDADYMTREVFFKEYYSMGRPFILRNHVPLEGMKPFARSHPFWDASRTVPVGSTAYPNLTEQKRCAEDMAIADLERGTKCEEMPDTYMVHAWHPKAPDFLALYPEHDGDPFHERGGWRKIKEWFGEVEEGSKKLGWQIFLGGDRSGATFHFHNAAVNALYVGVKEWVLAPPSHRGFTGMQARDARPVLDRELTVRCTQYPGDVVFFPNYWGHLTINHGFTIGAATILNDAYQSSGLRNALGDQDANKSAGLTFSSEVTKDAHGSKS